MPQRRQNSIVRTPMRSILGCSILPLVFSISVQPAPRQPRSPASASPTGPAPTIRTGVRVVSGINSNLVLLLQRVERILADEALALGEIDREPVGVADLTGLAQHAERELHAAKRGLQREVGIEHAGEAELLELVVRKLGRLAAEHDIDELRPGQFSDGCDLLGRFWRLDEADISAGVTIAVRALERGLETVDRNGVGSRHDDEAGIAARIGGGLDLGHHLGGRDHLLAFEMAAALRKNLVLDLD